MSDRLLRLTNYDQGSHTRAITDLALTALNIGHASIRLQSICTQLAGKDLKQLISWQHALADAFLLATKGCSNNEFKNKSDALYTELVDVAGETSQVEAIKGMFMRINLTFERSAKKIAEA